METICHFLNVMNFKVVFSYWSYPVQNTWYLGIFWFESCTCYQAAVSGFKALKHLITRMICLVSSNSLFWCPQLYNCIYNLCQMFLKCYCEAKQMFWQTALGQMNEIFINVLKTMNGICKKPNAHSKSNILCMLTINSF